MPLRDGPRTFAAIAVRSEGRRVPVRLPSSTPLLDRLLAFLADLRERLAPSCR